MQTAAHYSRQFRRTTWDPGLLCQVFAELRSALRCDIKSVRFASPPAWHTENEIEDLYEVTEIPMGDASITIQLARDKNSKDCISHLDVITLGADSADTVDVIFRANESHCEFDVLSNRDALAVTTVATLIKRLSLIEIPVASRKL